MLMQHLKIVASACALCTSLVAYAQQPDQKKQPEVKKWGEGNIPKNGMGPYITLDALLWKPHQNNLEFVLKSSSETDVQLYVGPESSPNFSYEWGVRFGLGYSFKEHDDWDVYTNWTHLNADASNTVTAGSAHALQAVLTSAYGGSYFVHQAVSKWNLKLNMIDLELGKQFYVSKFFAFRGFVGLRNAWVYQSNYITYSGDQLETNGKSPTNVDFKNDFWGLGILGGLETFWGLGAGVSIYANASISVLSGLFSVSSKETIPDSVNNNVTDSFRSGKSIIDLGLGIRWDKTFCNEKYHVALRTGWEQLLFPDQYQWQAQDTPPYTNTDLTINGWILSMQFDF